MHTAMLTVNETPNIAIKTPDIANETSPIRYPLNLRLFDGAAGAVGAPGASGPGDPAAPAAAARQPEGDAAQPEPKVVYGKESPSDAQSATSPAVQDGDAATAKPDNPSLAKEAEFEKLIHGEYEKEFQARTQRMIDERFKAMKSLEERDKAISPVLQMMAGKYGVDPSDTDALAKAIQEDDSYYEEEAIRRGMTVSQLKEVMRLERENEQYRRDQQAQEEQRRRDETIRGWMQQETALKQSYPDFNLRAELGNPQSGERFGRLINSGVDMRTAYEVIHQAEIQENAMRAGEARTINNIRSRGNRPDENGAAAATAPVVRKADPNKLTNEDLADIEARVKRGEIIAF